MALTTIKTGGLADNSVTDAKVADAITVTGAQTGITQVGTLTAGTWNGTAIASAYLDADTAHLSGSTFTGSVQISHGTTPDFTLNDTNGTTNKRVFRISGGGDAVYFEGRNNGNTDVGAVGAIQTLSLSDASTTFGGNVKVGGTDATLGLKIEYDQSSATTTKITANPTYTNTSALMHLCVDGDANPNQLVLQGDGSVGIGYATPSNFYYKGLSVGKGDSSDTGITIYGTAWTALAFADGVSGADRYAGYLAYNHANNSMNFGTSDSDRMMIRTGLSIKGAFVNSVDNNPDSYQISFGGDNTANPRWGFRVGDSSDGENLYLDRNLNVSGRANALKIDKSSGDATFAGAILQGSTGFNLTGSVGRIKINGTSGGDNYMWIGNYNDNGWGYIESVNNGNGLYFNTNQGHFHLDSGSLLPYDDNEIDLGSTGKRFGVLHAVTGTINTSDKRHKDNIKTSSLGLEFLNKLNPVQYKWKDYEKFKRAKPEAEEESTDEVIKHTHKRTHYGLIAQEVEKVLTDSGMTTEDFAPLTYDEEADLYGMRYSEYVGILIKAVQELSAEVEALKNG